MVRPIAGPGAEDFWELADRTAGPDGCWPWKRGLEGGGYGWFRRDRAHRHAYRFVKGEIPAELEIDHLCRNRRCVNPAHLEAVTHAENMRRAVAHRAKRKTCPSGHPFEGNRTPSGRCRPCHNAETNRRYHVTKIYKGRVRPPNKICKNGHDMTDPANVRLDVGTYVRRVCRACNRDQWRKRHWPAA